MSVESIAHGGQHRLNTIKWLVLAGLLLLLATVATISWWRGVTSAELTPQLVEVEPAGRSVRLKGLGQSGQLIRVTVDDLQPQETAVGEDGTWEAVVGTFQATGLYDVMLEGLDEEGATVSTTMEAIPIAVAVINDIVESAEMPLLSTEPEDENAAIAEVQPTDQPASEQASADEPAPAQEPNPTDEPAPTAMMEDEPTEEAEAAMDAEVEASPTGIPTPRPTMMPTAVPTAVVEPTVAAEPAVEEAMAADASEDEMMVEAPAEQQMAAPEVVVFRPNISTANVGDIVKLIWEINGVDSLTLNIHDQGGNIIVAKRVEASGAEDIVIQEMWIDRLDVTLSDESDRFEVETAITLNCATAWVIDPVPSGCPIESNFGGAGAQQNFEGGTMIWVGELDQIFIISENGMGWRVDDEFEHDVDPIVDESIEAPEGRQQPAWGLGKAWRETPGVRDQLSWALTNSLAYEPTVQCGADGTCYLASVEEWIIVAAADGDWRVEQTWTTLAADAK